MSIIHVPDLDVTQGDTQSLDLPRAKGITGGANVTVVDVPVGQSGVTNVVLTPEDNSNVVVVNNNNPSATTNIIFSKPSSVV